MLSERLKIIISNAAGTGKNEVLLDSRFREDLGMNDQANIWDLSFTINDEYGTELSLDEVEQLVTVRDLVTWLEQHGCTP